MNKTGRACIIMELIAIVQLLKKIDVFEPNCYYQWGIANENRNI